MNQREPSLVAGPGPSVTELWVVAGLCPEAGGTQAGPLRPGGSLSRAGASWAPPTAAPGASRDTCLSCLLFLMVPPALAPRGVSGSQLSPSSRAEALWMGY